MRMLEDAADVEEEADDAAETVEAQYLGKTVRVDLEDMSVIDMFGESGVVVAASAKEQTASFVTEKKHTHTAKTDEFMRLDEATIARYTPLMGWRLSSDAKIAMLMGIGMDSSEDSWEIPDIGTRGS